MENSEVVDAQSNPYGVSVVNTILPWSYLGVSDKTKVRGRRLYNNLEKVLRYTDYGG